jgi:hypothetical protein
METLCIINIKVTMTTVQLLLSTATITTFTKLVHAMRHLKMTTVYSRTSNNGHCRGIQILSVIGGVR